MILVFLLEKQTYFLIQIHVFWWILNTDEICWWLMNLIIDKKYKILDCGQLKKLIFCQYYQTNNAHGKIIYNLTLQEENNFCLKICKQTFIIQRVSSCYYAKSFILFIIIYRLLFFTLRVEVQF